jgi:hypothetical protein
MSIEYSKGIPVVATGGSRASIHTHPEDFARWVRELITFVESGAEPEDLARWRVPAS